METENTDQQQFDEQVDRAFKHWVPILGGVGIVAALVMSVVALVVSSDKSTTTSAAPSATPTATRTLPTTATIAIDHVTRGCHTLEVNGAGPGPPSASIHLAAGGTLKMQNNDVMPHTLVLVRGPQAPVTDASMRHMGATSTVTFAAPGTYSFSTKAGEDYMKGVTTTGPDNKLRIKVIVGQAA